MSRTADSKIASHLRNLVALASSHVHHCSFFEYLLSAMTLCLTHILDGPKPVVIHNLVTRFDA